MAQARHRTAHGTGSPGPGGRQPAPLSGKDLPDPMILFSEFSDGLLNRFLAACKEDGMPQIDYRAVVTEHNIHWNVLDLYQELVQEHESLHGGKVTL